MGNWSPRSSRPLDAPSITSDMLTSRTTRKLMRTIIRSPATYSQQPNNATVMSLVTVLPYNVSIYSVDSLIVPYGFDLLASETRPPLGLNISKALIDGHNFNVAASMLAASGVVSEFEGDEGGAGSVSKRFFDQNPVRDLFGISKVLLPKEIFGKNAVVGDEPKMKGAESPTALSGSGDFAMGVNGPALSPEEMRSDGTTLSLLGALDVFSYQNHNRRGRFIRSKAVDEFIHAKHGDAFDTVVLGRLKEGVETRILLSEDIVYFVFTAKQQKEWREWMWYAVTVTRYTFKNAQHRVELQQSLEHVAFPHISDEKKIAPQDQTSTNGDNGMDDRRDTKSQKYSLREEVQMASAVRYIEVFSACWKSYKTMGGKENKLTNRMRCKGLYLALHLKMEKDFWVRKTLSCSVCTRKTFGSEKPYLALYAP
ncbi:fasciclin-like arabinogalactan protein 4 [Tanacetum coccineum]